MIRRNHQQVLRAMSNTTIVFCFAALLCAGSWGRTEEAPPHPSKNPTSAIMLACDGLPADPTEIDFRTIPQLPAQHAMISDVRDLGGKWVHQHAYLAYYDDRYWAMWSDGPGKPRSGLSTQQHYNIVPGHDQPGTRVSYATSRDGLKWSNPRDLSGPPRVDGFGWIARGLWIRDGQLLALASHFNAPGYPGKGLSLEAFRWEKNQGTWEAHGTVLDDTLNNFPPQRLPSGQYMMTRRDHLRQVSVIVGGVKAIDDWEIRPVTSYNADRSPEEPYWYLLPDGKSIAGLIRDNRRSRRLLRTFSTDSGRTWSPIVQTNFPDATSKFFVTRTSRGFYVLVSNSNPNQRDPLTLAVSQDGLLFTHLFRLIGGRHVDYPHVIEHDDHLLIAFSGAKQTVEVLKVALDDLEKRMGKKRPTEKNQPADISFEFEVSFDRGGDIGQSFGSLFEASVDNGSLVIGAGFQNTYNTRYRADRHEIQFYVRPTAIGRNSSISKLPRPNPLLTGAYPFSRDGEVYVADDEPKRWSESSRSWHTVSAGNERDRMRIGNGRLVFGNSSVSYNGNKILVPPTMGRFEMFFYAHGHLCFYHVNRGNGPYRTWHSDEDGFSKLYACPWQPGDGSVDLEKARIFRLPVVGETTFAWGQLADQIVTGSNIGGFYVFSDGTWEMLLKPIISKSFQLYSSVAFYDRLLMGQYPTGRVFEYDGSRLTERPGAPPVLAGVSKAAREAQTTVIYGGDLFVGVWPWGELWRYAPDAGKWECVDRMFDHPQPTEKTVHPYDQDNRGHTPRNLWGQRISSLVPHGSDLLIGTSAKSPFPWEAELFPFLAPVKWKSYGMVYRLRMPGHLGATTKWTNGPTSMKFTIRADEMEIEQDGRKLATSKLNEPICTLLGNVKRIHKVTWGRGIYGPFRGRMIHHHVSKTPVE